ncbi:hypothetical protein SY88_21040 [Clostridiales bacterium PH28_bin88]|nr:hypothetical protein SY88_21040 [Clostridiales bacterium PH28_bin88]
MRVFVYEHLSAGGWRDGHQEHLLPEGAAMLAALLEDFIRMPGCTTVTVLDPYLDPGRFRAHHVFPGGLSFDLKAFRQSTVTADAVLVLAPETGGLLAKLTGIVERAGKLLLGCGKKAVIDTTFKDLTVNRWKGAGLPVPDTELVSTEFNSIQKLKNLPLPLVLKPRDGAGCGHTYLVRRHRRLEVVWDRIAAENPSSRFLAQEYVAGIAASVSLVVSPDAILPLSLNRQLLDAGEEFRYRGSTAGLVHPLAQAATELAARACTLFPGLRGYVGVDLVLAPQGAVLVELNPRITTSYLALRQAASFNTAELILRACAGEKLPVSVPLNNTVTVKLDELSGKFGKEALARVPGRWY